MLAAEHTLIVLDRGLPDRDGLQVLAAVRSAGIDTPTLVLTARGAVDERIEGLETGADDYLAKPCDLREFRARLLALERRARRPLTALAEALAVRGPQQLTPIRVEHPPSEIAPIVTALNRLVERLRERMETERRFTADAAHELRTPLAALQSDAELALESTGERRDAALSRLRAGTRRAARLVGQMLTLARIDPIAGIEDVERFELGALAQEVLSALAPVAARGELELSLDERTGAYIRGHAALIEVLLRNLVDNAIRYTPPGGQIVVSIGTDAQGVFLRVADSGPGIPREVRERVLQPFYRHAGANVPGTGLGLSIVVRVAKLHHATLTLGDAQAGGLEATVRFPADG
jgi:two-component system sensor histidine kinase QseC